MSYPILKFMSKIIHIFNYTGTNKRKKKTKKLPIMLNLLSLGRNHDDDDDMPGVGGSQKPENILVLAKIHTCRDVLRDVPPSPWVARCRFSFPKKKSV